MVLVIDDDVQMLSVLEFALATDGYLVRVAQNGEDGLEVAREARPDVIVLDLNMPGMKGDEVVRRLRGESGTASTPVLAFTSEPLGPADQAELLDSGFTAFLSKHAELDELLKTVRGLAA
jgi:CheY-like chemotaxis protein